MKKFSEWIYDNEWLAWCVLVAVIIANLIANSARKPKIVKDTADLLSSSVEKQVKKYNKNWKKDHETRVGVSFLKKDTDVYDYFKDLDLEENDYLMLFICEDDDCELKMYAGVNFGQMLDGDSDFGKLIKTYQSDVQEAVRSGNRGNVNTLTGTFYDNLDRYFAEENTPKLYVKGLNAQTGKALGFIGTFFGCIGSIIFGSIKRIILIGILVVVLIAVIHIKKNGGGGVSNRLG